MFPSVQLRVPLPFDQAVQALSVAAVAIAASLHMAVGAIAAGGVGGHRLVLQSLALGLGAGRHSSALG